ncbi:ankyrin repeat, SAM and basic leucine zipper domain-containing protein 1-like [Planococcus citri]|uniref:ankyrin repeat, SAM and basic leucine zipper domain-containing protein 1-like n=1 Tax=Planococcus citri TaxID=170843 RepID=UPI0031F80C63
MIRPAGDSDDDDISDFDDGDCDYVPSARQQVQHEPAKISDSERLRDAIKEESVDEVKKLLEEIRDLTKATDADGWNPVTLAAYTGNSEILRLILDRYPLDQIKDAYTPLMAACSIPLSEKENVEERKKCIELLLAAKIDIDFTDRYGVTALMLACKVGRIDIAEHLLSNQADVNISDNDGWTALFYAVNDRFVDLVKLLLKHHANVNKIDKRNRKAYDIAFQKNYGDIVDLLEPTTEVEHGDDYIASQSAEEKQCDILESAYPIFHENVMDMVNASPEMERYLKLPGFESMTLREFLTLKKDDKLREMGITFSSHRNMLLTRVRQFHLSKWSRASFGLAQMDETNAQYCSLLNIANFAATVFRQVYSLRSTLLYIKDDVQPFSKRNDIQTSLSNARARLIEMNERLERIKLTAKELSSKTQPFLNAQKLVD